MCWIISGVYLQQSYKERTRFIPILMCSNTPPCFCCCWRGCSTPQPTEVPLPCPEIEPARRVFGLRFMSGPHISLVVFRPPSRGPAVSHSIIAAHPGHRQKLLIVEPQTIPQEFSLLGFGGFSLLSSWDMPNFLPFLMSSFHVFSSWFMLQSPLQIKPLNVYCVLILW